jgi:glycine cleavage system H protein
MSVPAELSYTATHEWVRRDEGGVTVGITDYAQRELTDVVFIELPKVGRRLEVGEEICALESVKTVAYIYAPVAGVIAAVNEALRKQPSLINQDPYGEGWIVRLTPDAPEQSVPFLDAAAYQAKAAAESAHQAP